MLHVVIFNVLKRGDANYLILSRRINIENLFLSDEEN